MSDSPASTEDHWNNNTYSTSTYDSPTEDHWNNNTYPTPTYDSPTEDRWNNKTCSTSTYDSSAANASSTPHPTKRELMGYTTGRYLR